MRPVLTMTERWRALEAGRLQAQGPALEQLPRSDAQGYIPEQKGVLE